MAEAAGTVDVVVAFMEAVNRGDLAGAAAYLHEDVVIHEPPGLPYAGTYRGRGALQDLLATGIRGTWKRWRERENRYAASGGLVVRETVVTAIVRATGEEVEMPFIEMFEVSGGVITLVRPFYWGVDLQA